MGLSLIVRCFELSVSIGNETAIRCNHSGVFEHLSGLGDPVFLIHTVDLSFVFVLKTDARAGIDAGPLARAHDDRLMVTLGIHGAARAHGALVMVHHPGHGDVVMTHPGLPLGWAFLTLAGLALIAVLTVVTGHSRNTPSSVVNLATLPRLGPVVRFFTGSPWPLIGLKVLVAAAFLAVIVAGLFGNPAPERNLATTLTWNLWWFVVIISVFFVGTAWCSVCPWDTVAGWLVKRRLWRRGSGASSRNLKVPRPLRSIWPALFLLVGFTWLELGLGVTNSPLSTALLALLMVALALSCLAVFERKAFCRYACPVGRTIGFYSQLAPVELRPIDTDVCARCTTLECYHGTETVEPCPTHLTMGRFAQNTYCTSCGACVYSCPEGNVAWRLRSVAAEARVGARPHWDEAWFMLALWAITTFHGTTMKPYWGDWLEILGRAVGDSGQLLASFSLAMAAGVAFPILAYVLFVALTRRLYFPTVSFRRLFSTFAFAVVPVAFAYHVVHNLSHLAREGGGIGAVLADPLGLDTVPLKPMELHILPMESLIPEQLLFALQAGLVLWGFWMAVQILRSRGLGLLGEGGELAGWRLIPMLVFVGGASTVNLLLLTQEMAMRL